MSQVQRSTARSAATNESFAVREHVAPGPHGDRPGSYASAPADGRTRTVDARRSWRCRPSRSPSDRTLSLVHTEATDAAPGPHDDRRTRPGDPASASADSRIRTVVAARRSWRRRSRRSPAGSASPLVLTTIVRYDQAISPQPGSRPYPRRRRTATSAVSVESALSGNASILVHTRDRPTSPLVLTATDQAARRRSRRTAVSALSMVPPNEVRLLLSYDTVGL